MSFLDHIRICNAHDLSQFEPWSIGSQRVGWIHRDFAPRLAARPDLFNRIAGGWRLSARLGDAATRTAAVEAWLLELRGQGLFGDWREERYPVTPDLKRPPLMDMERAAVPSFGVRAYGVHLTGFVRRVDGLHIWVPRRAHDKPTYPGMLDNTVAGGQPTGLGLMENMIKECAEEAGIPEAIARRAKGVGCITYRYQSGIQLKPDVQYVFDLELPEDFTPAVVDGEVDSFELWPVSRVMERVRDTRDFKYNCNLVLIDFFVRHGLIEPDDPDYLAIVAGLRATLE
jgi:8-oxo-dGTP pyrophosphatase MutT (NUDIX family)